MSPFRWKPSIDGVRSMASISVLYCSTWRAPEAAANLAAALVDGGRLEVLDTDNLMKIVRAPDGDLLLDYLPLEDE